MFYSTMASTMAASSISNLADGVNLNLTSSLLLGIVCVLS